MSTIDEKRVYGESAGALGAYVGSSMGVVHVKVSGSAVGEFSLCQRSETRDVAAGPGSIAAAGDEDVLVADPADPDSFAETGFGPAVGVSHHGDTLLAAGPDGRIARRHEDGWETLTEALGPDVRAMDGDLIGTENGVYRVHNGELDHAGLTEVRDVSATGIPLAATESGLYKLGNGWMETRSGSFDTVAADPASKPGELERAHAVADGIVYEHTDDGSAATEWVRDEEWGTGGRGPDEPADENRSESASSSDPVVGFGYDETVYAITSNGTFLVADSDEWRPHVLGVTGVTGLAVPEPSG